MVNIIEEGNKKKTFETVELRQKSRNETNYQ